MVPADGDALHELYARCSTASRFQRFGGYLHELPATFLRACLAGDPTAHDALVVVAGDVSERLPVVALGTAALVDTPTGPAADLSLLVEDAWQRRGLGRRLFDELLERASARGVGLFSAQVTTEQTGLAAWVARQLDVVDVAYEREAVTVLGRRRPAAA